MMTRTTLFSSALLCAITLFGLTAATGYPAAEPVGKASSPNTIADDSVRATGPNPGTTLEDRVEILWTTELPVEVTSSFHISRDDTLLAIAAPSESIYEDFSAIPHVTYEYCVSVVPATGPEVLVGCDDGKRVIAAPTGFDATDGLYEDLVRTTWSDQSEIEGGFNIYRDAGNALQFDGTNDYASAGMIDLGSSFTFEFWSKRTSTGTEDFVINLELDPNGDPQDPDVEVGYTADGHFLFSFGTDALTTPDPYDDTDAIHHWAVSYDAPSGRRIIYRDGELVVTDVTADVPRQSYELEIGRRESGGSPRSRGWFGGQIDEVRHWNVALTTEKIRSRMTALLAGSEPGLVGYWPMDVASGLSGPDAVGDHTLTLVDFSPTSWIPTTVPELRREVGANLTSYADRMAVVGFQSYAYRIAAFEDFDGDGLYTTGTDFESEIGSGQMDSGWRGFLTPPGNVSATDGEYNDRVVVSWNDLSNGEDGYRIYRNTVEIGSASTDAVEFSDLTPATNTIYEYCVVATGSGTESEPTCDKGRAGGLAPPADVAASDTTHFENGDPTKPLARYDDRVSVTWTDTTATEDGFEIWRDGSLIATVDADAEEYNDLSAVQGRSYDYCVRAFSEADPLDPAFSAQTCAPNPGIRVIVLEPTDLAATNDDFEDRVDLGWRNSSTTAMLFLVYRDNALIEVLDFNMTSTMDFNILSDTDYEYCVSAATVTSSNAKMMQGQIEQVLSNISMEDAVSETTGEAASTLEYRVSAVREVLGAESTGAGNMLGIAGLEESVRICDVGSRSILAPSEVSATDNEFESHVQLNWTDNSSIEAGYYIYRSGSTSPIDTLSANRSTYGDYRGTPGVRFDYTVVAFDTLDSRSQVDMDDGQRTLDPPTALTASDGTSESVVELDWKDNSDAEAGYQIFRRVAGTTDPFVLVGTTGKNEPAFDDVITDSNDLGRTFEYKVVAFDPYGESLGVTTSGETMLEAPANVNASNVYEDNVVVVWVDRSDVELGYEVTRRLVGPSTTPTTVATLGSNVTTFTDNPATTDEYQYCVRATLTGNIKSDPTCDNGQKFDPGSGGGGTTAGVQPFKIVSPFRMGNSIDLDQGIRFGASVAISGVNALIGVPGADPLTTIRRESDGVAIPWVVDPATNTWSKSKGGNKGYEGEFGLFRPPYDGDCCDYNVNGREYGHSVDVSGDYLIIGDPFTDEDNAGRFSIYKRNTTSGAWGELVEIGAGHPGPLDNTGYSVALANEYAVIGNPQYEIGAFPIGHGAATICNAEDRTNNPGCDRDSGIPKLEDLLLPSEVKEGASFGYSVDIMREGDSLFALVGAPGNEAAYLFGCNIPLTTTTAPDPEKAGCSETDDWTKQEIWESRFAIGSKYGASVAINSQLVVIGAPGSKGIAIYERTGTGDWIEAPVTTRARAGQFGSSLALYNNTIVVGAPGEVISGIPDAGAVYVFDYTAGGVTAETFRYDARAGGQVLDGARFGSSVAFDGINYLVGSPGDDGFVLNEDGDADSSGAAYSIPVGFEPPDTAVIPRDVDLATPGNIRASDGTSPDRIQIRWKDESLDEDGHVVYRGNTDGDFDRIADVGPNVQFFDDIKAAPGEAYEYCVSAFYGESETERACDVGWQPPNGTIAGRISERQGSATVGAEVCLVPSPNMASLFDGVGGYVVATVGDELDVSADFSVEAWIRPHDVVGSATVVSKDKDWALELTGNQLQFKLFREQIADEVVTDSRPILPDVWTHVAVSYSSGNNSPNATFFIDGAAGASFPTVGFSSVKGDTLTIGYTVEEPTTYFDGEIDEVRLWTGARTAQEVDSLRSVPLVGKEENLLGYWPLDQGSRGIAPDLSESANHGKFANGVYTVDEGADLDVCTFTTEDGNYSIAGIRYGDITEFDVIPSRPGREFSPSFKKISLAVDSPVQNEVAFVDVTSLGVSGLVQFVDQVGLETLSCPVPGVVIHTSKNDVASDDNVRLKTGADGSYATSVDPSSSLADTWFIIPTLVDPQDASLIHQFSPPSIERYINEPQSGVDFQDLTRYRLSGFFSGGDPETCHQNIGVATVRIFTEDGCYSREFTVDSGIANGAFPDLDLPPLNYLMEVMDVDVTGSRAQDIKDFFDALGAVEVDLTRGPVERNLTYRAPIVLTVENLEGDQSCTDIDQIGDGVVLRTLPSVKVIGDLQRVPVDIQVREDYGNGLYCDVDEGTVTIYDAIADRVDKDSTIALSDGPVKYETIGASPNIFSGARIQGVDRSFQKPITVVAQVEGRKSLVDTKWAIVEGFRERAATFVSAVTEEFPLLILHDPPGSNSYAFIEKGNTMCTRISNTKLSGFSRGIEAEVKIGFKLTAGPSFIVSALGDNGAGIWIKTRTVAGLEGGGLNGENIEICMSVNENFSTSSDPGWVGEDVFAGVALNLIFALADVLEANQCTVTLSETIATDLDQADPFETTYLYGKSHIAQSLIPELENLIRLGGDATVEGDLNGVQTPIRLQSAVENWRNQLTLNETLISEGINSGTPDPFDEKNRSFSGGTSFSHTQTVDTTRVTAFTSTRIFVDSENTAGLSLDIIGFDQNIGIAFDQTAEWNSETESTEASSQTIGYVLADEDAGDFFTVDVGIDPRYNTKVFSTLSGRSSNPWESNTQKRDNPIITVDPPVQFDVDPTGAGVVQLTLINGSESNERRRYVIAAPGETNPQNLGLEVGGARLGGTKEYLLDPGKAITVDMEVTPSTSTFSYKDVGIMMYPPDEYNIWIGDTRLPFALSDTAFFSVFFDSTGGNVQTSVLAKGWNWVSTNRAAGDLESMFERVALTHDDLVRDKDIVSRYDSTLGWVGDLTEIKPGVGYRLKVQRPGYFRVTGEPVESTEPLTLERGWNWIGYLPTKQTHVGEALESLHKSLMEGDAVVGQDGFAQYVKGVGWVGTLTDMSPGESYAIYSVNGGQLMYPLEPTNEGRPVNQPRQTTVRGPEWEVVPQDFTTSMTVVAEVQMSGQPLEQTTTKIAVVAGDEIRGLGEVHFVEGLDQHLAFIQIYGEFDEVEDMVVHVFDGEAEVLYEDVATVKYSAQQMLGQPGRPVVLDLAKAGLAPQLLDLPEEFALYPNYPNPFNPLTTIGYDLPEASRVTLIIYDIIGRQVVKLVDREQIAGRHRAVFDARSYASGLYMYRLEAGDFRKVGKMMLVK